ncbi:MAG: M23 family metallopeptidase [Myxococcales bacterium]|nr:M23 family metallopeptidase [Myxococcales bacterium]
MSKLLLATIALSLASLSSPASAKTSANKPIGAVVVHPLFKIYYSCAEHYAGQFKWSGDALGADCVVMRLRAVDRRYWARAYRGKGHRNRDWFGWRAEVLAPIGGVVVKVNVNPKTNKPGIMGRGKASMITIKRADGVHVVVAHVRELQVKVGQHVRRGQVIARVGNNGFSRHPHIHIGAWRNKTPLQLRFDQRKIPKAS